MERAMGHLKIIIPVTVAAIFFLLFLLFNSLRWPADHPGAAVCIDRRHHRAVRHGRIPVGAGVGGLHRAVGHRGAQRGGAGVVHPHLRESGMSLRNAVVRAPRSVSVR
jgi:cobalt-zinc-cadmium resistance protein CzcA